MAQERPRWPSWSQDGANMERQGLAKMAELEPRWPKRAPRWSQDGQIGAKMEPTWLQDAKDALTWADIWAYLEKPRFSFGFC